MKLNNYFQDPQTLHIGTEPLRSYYVPCATEEESLNIETDMMNSSRTIDLNGDDWKFHFYESFHEIPEALLNREKNFQNFDEISVPSCWQILGYDKRQYVNARYPIPFDPPYVPDDNPAGVYVKDFLLTKEEAGRRLYLNFDGVDSCYYLWLNGEFVGYSQISHSGSEFEITNYIKEGKNQLFVIVLKWCDGTYLEDQDKLRLSGIFRDVYILLRPQNYIRDYTVSTEISEDFQEAEMKVCCQMEGNHQPVVKLYHPDGRLLEEKRLTDGEGCFFISKPVLWNAETPDLYTMTLQTEEECIAQKVGIRKIEVCKNMLLINGVKVKIKGVNRHDSDPFTGAAISREQFLKDLKLMKEHNVNAIRTSHYPNSPWTLQLCDRFGFYVMDEADLEAHGCGAMYGGVYEPNDMSEVQTDMTIGYLMQDESYEKAVLDRIQHLVMRDKNSASVFSWSLGNESGYGPNLEKAVKWIKSVDPSRVISYENSIWQMPDSEYENDISGLDLFTRMYSSLDFVDLYCSQEGKKPFMEIEYCHAMGNGPGDLEEYFQRMYQYDGYAGGFVWEWCDHSIYMGKTVNGKDKYYYGGDWNETLHDGNFCMDGLVYPDRTPHTGLLEFKNVARPIRASWKHGQPGVVVLENKMNYINIRDRYDICYEVVRDGKKEQTGILEPVDCPAGECVEIEIPCVLDAEGNTSLHLRYLYKEELPFLERGYEAGHDQLFISSDQESAKKAVWNLQDVAEQKDCHCEKISVEDLENTIVLTGDHFRYVFDKWKGSFSQLVKNHKNLIQRPIELNVWRAPMDNDRWIRVEWEKAGYDQAKIKVYQINHTNTDEGVCITVSFSLGAPYLQRIMSGKMKWKIDSKGTVSFHLEAEKKPMQLRFAKRPLDPMPFLPRFGLRLFLDKEYDNVTYFGYGPMESYVDKCHDAWKDLFESSVKDMHEDYIFPQENGSHCGCLALALKTSDQRGLLVSGQEFSFNASMYTQEELTTKKHNFELEESPYMVLCLDGYMSGCGSDSCGHRLLEKYQVNEELLELNFVLEIV